MKEATNLKNLDLQELMNTLNTMLTIRKTLIDCRDQRRSFHNSGMLSSTTGNVK